VPFEVDRPGLRNIYPCEFCGRDATDMVEHYRQKHGFCDGCLRAFPSKGCAEKHLRRSHSAVADEPRDVEDV